MSTSTTGDPAETAADEESFPEGKYVEPQAPSTDAAATPDAADQDAIDPLPTHPDPDPDPNPDPYPVSSLSIEEAQASVEALLYASAEPLNVRELKKALPEAPELVTPSLLRLQEIYGQDGRGVQLVEVAGGWQITTRPAYHECVGRLVESPKPARLSLQALETLAVIAYRQPVTVPEIMELRGVRSAGVVRTLLERKLIKISGRKNVVGRPLLYSTTKEFLLRFGLKGVKDLPQLKDMSEVFGDDVTQQLEVLETLDLSPAPEVHAAESESESESESTPVARSESDEESEQGQEQEQEQEQLETEPEAETEQEVVDAFEKEGPEDRAGELEGS